MPVFLINSRYSHFSATQTCFRNKSLHKNGHTFSRSYGVKLPSSLTKIHPIVLGYSPHSPESVYGTGNFLKYRRFSWNHGFSHFRDIVSRIHASVLSAADLPTTPPTRLHRNPITGCDSLSCHSYGNPKLVTEY